MSVLGNTLEVAKTLELGKTLEIDTETITLEDGSSRKRPVMVMSLLGDKTSSKEPAPHPLAYLDEEGYGDPMNGFDKGHIIARQFIGSAADVNGNIVPLDPTFNRSGLWKKLELELYEQVKRGQKILMQVGIEYLATSPLIPSALVVSARDQKSLSQCTFGGIGLKRVRFTPPEIAPVQMSETDLRAEYGDDLYNYIIFLETWFNNPRNIDQKTYDISRQSFLANVKCGPFGVPRPYQCLDFAFALVDSNAVKTYCGSKMKIANGEPFRPRQRALIQLVNRMRNNGWLVSDDPKDPQNGHLTVGAGADAGHVDHIHPKAQAGANAFSNARLISRKHNESTKDTQKTVDTDVVMKS
jgi:hypothetical protein